MLLAAQSGNMPIVIALFALMLVTAKSKFLILAAIVGLVLTFVFGMELENKMYYILGGLFIILLLIVKTDSGAPQPYGGGGGYY